ncbi:eukaryotic translation initiation factor 5B-like [Triticum dicoccoides]|uniref:eukaryotic translation initiation factor 5B-like n=1 Tax=Triticum dicoccoides TaxID=85692 RepID=UPI00189149E1|nr:eukaryotic translation initiation factor 5B-like [Triticum dicoccoides]
MSSRKTAGPSRATAAGAKKVASGPGGMSLRALREGLARQKEEEERRAREQELQAQAEEARRRRDEEEEEERRKLREQELKRREEDRQRRRLEERKREEGRRAEEARRRLGITSAVVEGGGAVGVDDGPKKRPVYQSRRPTLKPKTVESEADGGGGQGLSSVSQEEENSATINEALKLGEGSSNGSLEEDRAAIGDEDEDEDDEDAWDCKSLDEFDVMSAAGNSHSSEEEETKGKHVASAAPVVNAANDAGNEIVEDIFDAQDVDGDEKELRAPICCILGHVDAGKTKLLDCIRGTHVQEREAGGITQQIGATYIPAENIRDRTSLKAETAIKVPGLLVIDTPGHESFSKMRSRGLSMCDIAVVVVDITQGLEKQTIESLHLLRRHNVSFIVTLNKVDRLYGWKECTNAPIVEALKKQSDDVKSEYKWRLTKVVTEFKENGFNTAPYYENNKKKKVVNIVPTSAESGEGVPDLLLLLVRWLPGIITDKLAYDDTVECTVLEVNEHKDLGTTVDVVLINGVLHQGDQVIVCTKQGPVTTIIRDLLTPHPMKELKAKGAYKHHKEVRAAQGVKIVARGLQYTMAGTSLIVVKPGDDLRQAEAAAMQEIDMAISTTDENEKGTTTQEVSSIVTSKEGIYVQASSVGTLEAIIAHLKSSSVDIPVYAWNLGPVYKQDVMKASAMLKRKEEYAVILAFDVKVMPEASALAAESGLKIITADTVYRLVNIYTEHIKGLKEAKKMQFAAEAVFPCTLKILPNRVYHSKDPIVCDVEVVEGVVKVGTPICVFTQSKDKSKNIIVHSLGRISSMQTSNGNQIFSARNGVVAIKISGDSPQEKSRSYGRHFDSSNELVSEISRRSIDVLKECFRDEMSAENWQLITRLKTQFKIA